MPCKNLVQFVIEASRYFEVAVTDSQNLPLPDCYLVTNSMNQVLDDSRSWSKMAFIELMHGEYCYKQTLLAIDRSSNHLVDS